MLSQKPRRVAKKTKAKPCASKGRTGTKGGRPSLYSAKLVKAIADRLSKGEPMAVICRDKGMPGYQTVKDWMSSRPEVSVAIARAREEGFDTIAADCLRIADTPMPGTVEKRELLGVLTRKGENGEDQDVVLPDAQLVVTEERTEDMLGHRKLQIETRLKLLAKWDPKRYGDKIQQELSGPGGGPIRTITTEMTPQEAAAAYAATLNGE